MIIRRTYSLIMIKKLSLVLILINFWNATYAQSNDVALNFDGIDDYVSTKYNGILDSGSRSMEAWIRTTGNYDPNNGGKQGVIANYGTMSNTNRFTFCVLFNNAIRIEVGGNGLSGTIAVNDGDWHHVAVTYDPKDSLDYRLYVDGTLDIAGNLKIATNTITTTPLQFGMRIDNINLFEGDIDEFRMYNYALTPKEINNNMDRELCDLPKGILAYYKFNEGKANTFNYSKKTATDYSGNNYHGTLNYFTLSGTASNWITGSGIKGGPSETRIQMFDCDTVISPTKKYKWTRDGLFRDTFESYYGCDSVILVSVDIGNDSISIPQFACGGFTSPLGKTVSTDTIITEYYTSIKGCDSIVSYEVYILPVFDTIIPVLACEKFQTPLGHLVTKDSIVSDSFTSLNGCDSVVNYYVTINRNQYRSDTLMGCDSVTLLGKTYFKSQLIQNTYKTYSGCDSFQTTWIRVNFSQEIPMNITTCDSFVSDAGIVYRETGQYTESYSNVRGCDSTRVYNLKIGESKIIRDTVYSCERYWLRDSSYTKSTIVEWIGKTYTKCDSFHITYLDITAINKDVTVNDSVLFLNETLWDSITWYDCKTSEQVGEKNKASLLIPYTGIFKAKIFRNSCESVTDCYSSERTNKTSKSNLSPIGIFPNPSNGNIEIKGLQKGDFISIHDLNGKSVSFIQDSNQPNMIYDIQATGLVIVKIYSKDLQYNHSELLILE